MSDKFLGSSGANININNGTATIFGSTIGAINLDPSQPIKTNSVRQLVSSKLDIADINNLQSELDNTISNPLTGDLNVNTNNINNINSNEFNKMVQPSNASVNTLKLYASNVTSELHMVDENGVDSVVGGDTFDQSLNTNDSVEFVAVVADNIDSSTVLTIGANSSNLNFGNNSNVSIFNNIVRTTRPVEVRERLLIGLTQAQEYSMPTTKGNINDVMVDKGTGVGVQWVAQNTLSPYDQSLNTSNDVVFNLVESKNMNLVDLTPQLNFYDQTITKKFTIQEIAGQLHINNGIEQNQIRIINNNSVQFPYVIKAYGGLEASTINETFNNSGVLVDGVLLKDSGVECSNIIESKNENGAIFIKGNPDFITQYLQTVADDNVNGCGATVLRARGTIALPTQVLSGDSIAFYNSTAHSDTGYNVSPSSVVIRATENYTSTSAGTSYQINVCDVGSVNHIQKILLNTEGVTINSGVNSISLPNLRGSTGQVLKTDGVGQAYWGNSTGIFSQTNTTIVQNTLSAVNVIGTGVGSSTIPSNSFKIGDSYSVKIGGDITCANGDLITWVVRTSAGAIFSTLATSLSASTAQPFELEIDFVVRTLGVATVASISNNGQFTYQQNSQSNYQGGMTNGVNNTTFDTTVDNTLVVTAQPDNVAMIINTFQCIIHRTFP
jgi:hypothetical protein